MCYHDGYAAIRLRASARAGEGEREALEAAAVAAAWYSPDCGVAHDVSHTQWDPSGTLLRRVK